MATLLMALLLLTSCALPVKSMSRMCCDCETFEHDDDDTCHVRISTENGIKPTPNDKQKLVSLYKQAYNEYNLYADNVCDPSDRVINDVTFDDVSNNIQTFEARRCLSNPGVLCALVFRFTPSGSCRGCASDPALYDDTDNYADPYATTNPLETSTSKDADHERLLAAWRHFDATFHLKEANKEREIQKLRTFMANYGSTKRHLPSVCEVVDQLENKIKQKKYWSTNFQDAVDASNFTVYAAGNNCGTNALETCDATKRNRSLTPTTDKAKSVSDEL